MYKENTKGYKVLTPDGYKSFAGIRCLGERSIYRVEFENGYWLECTENHKVFVNDSARVTIDQLVPGNIVLTNKGNIQLTANIDLHRKELVYDLIEVDGGHRYYTNGILSSNCEFIRDDETLIDPLKLARMEGVSPINKQGQVRWYKEINPKSTYIVALDPSIGTGGDPAAIEVFELPSCEQVAEWCHNKTPVEQQIKILAEIVTLIAETVKTNEQIYYSLENNTIGEAGLVSLREYGEENIPGTMLSEPHRLGNVRKHRKGFSTTHSSKLSACAKLKNFVETDKLVIKSKPLISELKNFISSGTTYKALTGQTDDLVMATVLAVRMIAFLQSYDANLDDKMRNGSDEPIRMPMPFIIM